MVRDLSIYEFFLNLVPMYELICSSRRLVATLGSRSITRRLNKKAILDVDVPKACEVIMDPAAPMALRLQGNLL
jgi:hypothetical protein